MHVFDAVSLIAATALRCVGDAAARMDGEDSDDDTTFSKDTSGSSATTALRLQVSGRVTVRIADTDKLLALLLTPSITVASADI